MKGIVVDLTLMGTIDGKEIRQTLVEGLYVIGRADEADIRLSEPSVSRRHAEIRLAAGEATLRDLGSHNGTKLNAARVEGAMPLRAGDVIGIANVTFTIGGGMATTASRFAASPTLIPGAEISWDEIQRERHDRRDRQSQLFTVLAEAGDLLTIPRAPEEMFEPILDLVETALDPERSFVLLLEDASDEPQIKASRLKGSHTEDQLALSTTMVDRVLQQKTSFLVSDAMNDPSLAAAQSMVAQSIRSAMAAPLFDNEKVIGLLYADDSDPGTRFSRDQLQAFTLLANVIAVALSHARFHALEEEKRKQDAQLQAAGEILQHMLPATLPECDGYELTARIDPCFEVGGDLYDVRRLPDGRYAVMIGDVVGKGLGAALLVSHVISLVRFMTAELFEPADLMRRLNEEIFCCTDSVRFTTVFLGYLEPDSGRVTYVNAGHNLPYVIRADGQCETLVSTGLPVGVLEEFTYTTGELNLAPGDLLALYSDGIPETHDSQDEEYGEERFEQLLVRERSSDLSAIVDTVQEELGEFRGTTPVGDDVTMLFVRRAAQ